MPYNTNKIMPGTAKRMEPKRNNMEYLNIHMIKLMLSHHKTPMRRSHFMKKLFTVTSLFGCLSWFASPALAAPSLEQLLSAIKEDISANRLSSPANNNA